LLDQEALKDIPYVIYHQLSWGLFIIRDFSKVL
jgi:hypothetical protein